MTDRPSKKERRQLAKQMHAQAARRSRARAIRAKIVRTVVILGLIVGTVFYFLNLSQQGRERVELINSVGAELGCTGSISADDSTQLTEFPSLGEAHIPGNEPINYPKVPPDSGDHRPGPGPTGIHRDPIDPAVQTHNLEHGHVALNYRPDAPDEIKQALNRVASRDTRWTIAAPLENFVPSENAISLVAWQYRIDCPALQASDADKLEDLAAAFVDARKDKAPKESIAGVPLSEEEEEEE